MNMMYDLYNTTVYVYMEIIIFIQLRQLCQQWRESVS